MTPCAHFQKLDIENVFFLLQTLTSVFLVHLVQRFFMGKFKIFFYFQNIFKVQQQKSFRKIVFSFVISEFFSLK